MFAEIETRELLAESIDCDRRRAAPAKVRKFAVVPAAASSSFRLSRCPYPQRSCCRPSVAHPESLSIRRDIKRAEIGGEPATTSYDIRSGPGLK